MPQDAAKPTPGHVVTMEQGVRRILAPNPSPMTYWGTNTYILGEGRVVVIDPGPADRTHFDAILAGLAPGEEISHILVTHSHLDHSPLARPLSEATGAPVLAFGDATAGRSDVMADLVARGMASGGEGVDRGFTPDATLKDADVLDVNGARIQALWTPGHYSNHLSFAFQGDAVFTGDHVMGWASSLVSPPDGDLTAFMASCEKLAARDDRVYYPGHGNPVEDTQARIHWLINHRRGREGDILKALSGPPQDIPTLTRAIYTDTPAPLLAAAARNVFAHLIDLTQRQLVRPHPQLDFTARFERIG